MDVSTQLAESEIDERDGLERVIDRGLTAFHEVGAALMRIKAAGLYRDYGTFEAYCSGRWDISRKYAYKVIAATTAMDNLRELSPIGDGGARLPANEAQARPLTRLDPAQQREAWQHVVKLADQDDRKITAALVGEVVTAMLIDEAGGEKSDHNSHTRAAHVMLWLAVQGERMSTAELAKRLEISPSGVWKIMDALCCFFPFRQDGEGLDDTMVWEYVGI